MQKEKIESYTESVKKSPSKIQKYERIPLNNLNRISSFDTSLVFTTFRHFKLTPKDYTDFYTNIDYLKEMFELIHLDYKSTVERRLTPLSNQFIEIREEILKEMALYIKDMSISNPKDEFGIYLENLILDYYNAEKLPKEPNLNYDYKTLTTVLLTEFTTVHLK